MIRKRIALRWGVCGLAWLVTACGGGSGSSNRVSFDPASVSLTTYESESKAFDVVATVSGEFSGSVYVVIVDKVGVIQPNPVVTQQSANVYSGRFESAPDLALGVHRSNIELHLCKDFQCTAEYSGSPAFLPLEINVISRTTNLSPLSPLAGAGDWKTYQGNAAHTGYVPVTLDVDQFTPRWQWRAPQTSGGGSPALLPVATGDDSVYVAAAGWPNSLLYALSETDRSLRWQYDFGEVNGVNPPAFGDGRVYGATSGHEDTMMWAFDSADGTVRFRAPFSAQWEHYYAPVVDAGSVFTNGGYYGGAYAFDAGTGAQQWFRELNQYDQWTPAVDANYVYAYVGESCSGCSDAGLNVIDRATGDLALQINDPQFDWGGWSIYGSPVIGSDGSVLAVGGSSTGNRFAGESLISFNVGSGQINWSVAGAFQSNPSAARGVVYIANLAPLQLEARDQADGEVLWTWVPQDAGENSFSSDVLVTDNLAFVATNETVYAIDLATRRSVWSHPGAGALAMSANGVLYVLSSDDGILTAINLH